MQHPGAVGSVASHDNQLTREREICQVRTVDILSLPIIGAADIAAGYPMGGRRENKHFSTSCQKQQQLPRHTHTHSRILTRARMCGAHSRV